jgi:hypothetical protein
MTDLVIGTHGRSFWILDNSYSVAPVKRTIDSFSNDSLYKPPEHLSCSLDYVYRSLPYRRKKQPEKILPDGAMIDYYLPEKAKDRNPKFYWFLLYMGKGRRSVGPIHNREISK